MNKRNDKQETINACIVNQKQVNAIYVKIETVKMNYFCFSCSARRFDEQIIVIFDKLKKRQRGYYTFLNLL